MGRSTCNQGSLRVRQNGLPDGLDSRCPVSFSDNLALGRIEFNLGCRFTWGVEMSYCTPYLLQLGMAKSLVSLVWIAGPLSGLIMQPVVGILADRSTSPWGRRRPFMVGGAVIVSVLLMILGWAEELVSLFVSNQDLKRKVTITLAVLCIYAIDFAINSGK